MKIKSLVTLFYTVAFLITSPVMANVCNEDIYFGSALNSMEYINNPTTIQRPAQIDLRAALTWMRQCRQDLLNQFAPAIRQLLFPDGNQWEYLSFVDFDSMTTVGWGAQVSNDKGYKIQLMCAAENMSELLLKVDMTSSQATTNFTFLQYGTQDLGKAMSVVMGFEKLSKKFETTEPWVIESGHRKVISTSLDYQLADDRALIQALRGKISTQFRVHIEGFDGAMIDTEFSLSGSNGNIEKLLIQCGLIELN